MVNERRSDAVRLGGGFGDALGNGCSDQELILDHHSLLGCLRRGRNSGNARTLPTSGACSGQATRRIALVGRDRARLAGGRVFAADDASRGVTELGAADGSTRFVGFGACRRAAAGIPVGRARCLSRDGLSG